MKRFTYVVSDRQGLHAMNALQLSKAAGSFQCKIEVARDGARADCKNVLSVMGLSAKQGDKLVFCAEGEDESAAASYLEALLRTIL